MILSEFYLAIKTKLMDADLGIQYFDLWSDQIDRNENEEDDLFFNYPAVFLEFEPVDWQTLGRKKQAADVSFNLYIASENWNETNSLESDTEIDKGLAHLQLVDNIFAALQGFNGTNFGSITRTGFAFKHNAEWTGLITHSMPFKSRLTDTAAMVGFVAVAPSLDNTIVTESN